MVDSSYMFLLCTLEIIQKIFKNRKIIAGRAIKNKEKGKAGGIFNMLCKKKMVQLNSKLRSH
jgi:hypothetical protein